MSEKKDDNGHESGNGETPQEREQREAYEELQRALRAKQNNPKNN